MSASDPCRPIAPAVGRRPSQEDAPEATAAVNLKKRTRTACTRCKNRKQKCDESLPVCSNCRKAGAKCDKADVANNAPPPIAYTRALEERVAQLEILLAEKRSRSERRTSSSAGVRTPGTAVGNTSPGSGPGPGPPSAAASTAPGGERNSSSDNDMSTLNEVVGIISLGNFEAPAYVGPSAGLSLAVNLGEMVQATVWKKAIPEVPRDTAGPRSPGSASVHADGGMQPLPLGGVRAMTMEELARYSMKEPPSDELCVRLINIYLQQLHPRYPFVDPDELWRLQRARMPMALAESGRLSPGQRYGVFRLYMVFACAATVMHLTNKGAGTQVSPERFYMTALQHMAVANVPRTVQNIEAMTLLVVYHLRSASGMALWYMIGLAMRTCIDLGMHQKTYEQGLSSAAVDKRRRLFWTVYALERTIATSLGRPLSIPDRHIDVAFPDTSFVSSPGLADLGHSRNLESTNLLFELRRIEAHIHHSIYRTDKPLQALRPKMEKLHGELEAWRRRLADLYAQDQHQGQQGMGMDYPLLLYNRAIRMLIQPFLAILPVADPYYGLCLKSAGSICQMQKRLHQNIGYGHSFIAVQTIFVAGVTLLYGLWTQTHLVWSVTLANDLRSCSLVLFVMSERAPWVCKYRDAFEILADATMEKLRSGESSLAEMVAVAQVQQNQQQQQQQQPPHGDRQRQQLGPQGQQESQQSRPSQQGQHQQRQQQQQQPMFPPHPPEASLPGTTDTNSHNTDSYQPEENTEDVWRLVGELANWIDQDQSATPVWMPNFEAMQNMSSNGAL